MTTSRGDEFRRGWPTLSAAAVGVGTGVSGLAIYSAGLFTSDLGREIGLSAAMYGLSITLLTFGMALAAPVVATPSTSSESRPRRLPEHCAWQPDSPHWERSCTRCRPT